MFENLKEYLVDFKIKNDYESMNEIKEMIDLRKKMWIMGGTKVFNFF
jgi:hypothetical protein